MSQLSVRVEMSRRAEGGGLYLVQVLAVQRLFHLRHVGVHLCRNREPPTVADKRLEGCDDAVQRGRFAHRALEVLRRRDVCHVGKPQLSTRARNTRLRPLQSPSSASPFPLSPRHCPTCSLSIPLRSLRLLLRSRDNARAPGEWRPPVSSLQCSPLSTSSTYQASRCAASWPKSIPEPLMWQARGMKSGNGGQGNAGPAGERQRQEFGDGEGEKEGAEREKGSEVKGDGQRGRARERREERCRECLKGGGR